MFVSAKSGYNIKLHRGDRLCRRPDAHRDYHRCAQSHYSAGGRKGLSADGKRKRLKIYYATQSGTNPIYFRVFVNNPDLTRSNWVAYLKTNYATRLDSRALRSLLNLCPARATNQTHKPRTILHDFRMIFPSAQVCKRLSGVTSQKGLVLRSSARLIKSASPGSAA